jgi:hypothetical protein
MLVALGINKQLDFQSLLTQVARDLAQSQGWYSQRRLYQVHFIKVIALGGLVSLALLCWLCRHDWRRRFLALVGMIGLVGFIMIRASSFHHVDQLLGMRLSILKVNWIIEIGSIGCVTLAAVLASRDVEQLPSGFIQGGTSWTGRTGNHDSRWSR